MKIITENKIFHFLLRSWMFLSASDVCQISFFFFLLLFPSFWQFSFSVCLCLSLSLSLSHIKSEVGRYVSEESIITELWQERSRNSQTDTTKNTCIILLSVLSDERIFRYSRIYSGYCRNLKKKRIWTAKMAI